MNCCSSSPLVQCRCASHCVFHSSYITKYILRYNKIFVRETFRANVPQQSEQYAYLFLNKKMCSVISLLYIERNIWLEVVQENTHLERDPLCGSVSICFYQRFLSSCPSVWARWDPCVLHRRLMTSPVALLSLSGASPACFFFKRPSSLKNDPAIFLNVTS